jgi:hypothetical protein
MIGIGSINTSDKEYGSSEEFNDSDEKIDDNLTVQSPARLTVYSHSTSVKKYKKTQEEAYFVTIEIEDTFLAWLDDPEFIVPLDVIEKVQSLVQNVTFIQNVIKKEIRLRKTPT